MASVRLGRDTRRQIKRAALKAYEVAVQEPKLDNETKELVWKGIVEHPAHIAFTNFSTAYGDSFEKLTGRNHKLHKSDQVCLKYGDRQSEAFKLSTERSSWVSHSYYQHEVRLKNLHLSEEERLHVQDKIVDLAERREAARLQERNYERQITDLLDSCNTLKQLLDSQPSMKEFVPDHMMQDMHKKVTRESQARERREIANVDGDLINRVVLTSKLVA